MNSQKLKVLCPSCGVEITAGESVVGQKRACPRCSHLITVRDPENAAQRAQRPPPRPRTKASQLPPPRPNTSSTAPPLTKEQSPLWLFVGVPVGLGVLFVVGFLGVVWASIEAPAKAVADERPSAVEPKPAISVADAENELSPLKQRIFDTFHPVGTAKSLTVHAVATNDTDQGLQTEVRYTVRWEGPLQTGYTKIRTVVDHESGAWVVNEVLATNGVTNQEVGEAVAQGFKDWMEEG